MPGLGTVRTVLVGLGGYGNGYVNAALDRAGELGIELVGAVDPAPDGCIRREELAAAVGRIHPTLEAFYAEREADLAVISAPIHLHAPFTITALRSGSHVLCEKPVAAVVEDARAMGAAAEECGRSVTVGYQWSFSGTIQRIRRDVRAGRFGRPVSLRTLVLWPRAASYYGRSSWAGLLRTPDGKWVMDSPANNATAHYLHNPLFILGEAGTPVSVEAELYRANRIESFDTAAIRVETACGARVLFSTTHAVPSNVGPVIWYRFSEADVYCDVPGHFYVRRADGSVEDYGCPDVSPAEKIERVASDVAAARDRGEAVASACSVADATEQLRVVAGAHRSSGIREFPPALIRRTTVDPVTDDELTWVDGLQAALVQCFAQDILPAEHGGIGWAEAGSRVDLD